MKKFLVVFGAVLFVLGLLLALSPVALASYHPYKLFSYFFGWTKGYEMIVSVLGFLSAVAGGVIFMEASFLA